VLVTGLINMYEQGSPGIVGQSLECVIAESAFVLRILHLWYGFDLFFRPLDPGIHPGSRNVSTRLKYVIPENSEERNTRRDSDDFITP
jgi:hypothetical protein